MMAANYQHIGGGVNRLGRHYSRFSGFWPMASVVDQSLALRKSQNRESNRRRRAKAVQQLSSATLRVESCPSMIGPISLEAKQMGARSAGNPHAACDAEGAGNVARPRYWDTRRRKGEPTGEPNFGLTRRASPRPYR